MALSHSIAYIPAGLVFTQLAVYLKAYIWFECTDTTEIPLLSLSDVSDSSPSSSLPAKYSVISASKALLSGHASQRKGTSLVRTLRAETTSLTAITASFAPSQEQIDINGSICSGPHNLVSSSSTQWQTRNNNSAGEQAKDLKLTEQNLKELVFVYM